MRRMRVVTLLTAAAIEAAVMPRVMPIVEEVMGDWRYYCE